MMTRGTPILGNPLVTLVTQEKTLGTTEASRRLEPNHHTIENDQNGHHWLDIPADWLCLGHWPNQ